MLKPFVVAGSLMLASAASAQQSLQSMHARVPAPPASAAAAPAWLASTEVSGIRKQLQDQRTFIESSSVAAGAAAQPAAQATGGIDFQRAARDPEYAKQVQAKIAAMSPAEQMKISMAYSQAHSQGAVADVVAMSKDPEAVKTAAANYPDYQMRQNNGQGISAQYAAVAKIRDRVNAREFAIAEKAGKGLRCSDGEGSCSVAEQAADKATLRAAFDQIIAEYDKALLEIGQQVEAARRSRLADITAAQRDLGPAQYGSAARSNTNRQLLTAYHNAVLMEIEQLFVLSEDTAKWAATRYQDHSINFVPF